MAAKIILTVKPSHQNNDTRQVLFPELFHFTATFKMNFVLQCNENRIFYYKIEFYSHTFLDWEGWVLIWLSPVLIKPIFDHQPFWRCFVKIYTSTKTPPLIVCFHKKSKGFLKNTPDQHYLWTFFLHWHWLLTSLLLHMLHISQQLVHFLGENSPCHKHYVCDTTSPVFTSS